MSVTGAPIHLRSAQIFATSATFSGRSQNICVSMTAISSARVAFGFFST